jgi:hypothetical protein
MAEAGDLLFDLRRPAVPSAGAPDLARGVCRLLTEMGFAPLVEVPLASGHRADVIGLDRRGRFAIVETKTTLADFRADEKWPCYLPHCDLFYFAVGAAFPLEVLPVDHGVIVADRYGAEVVRRAPLSPMESGTRRRQVLRYARFAAYRLHRRDDPEI